MSKKKKVSTKCQECHGKGVVPSDETYVVAGQPRVCYIACDACNGRGKQTRRTTETESRVGWTGAWDTYVHRFWHNL